MIPLKLELANFLSYRGRAVLDLSGIHLACIAGANGAGKSSLLDAITWALFGQSRSKSDDDLVNRLAAASDQAAEVVFAFELDGVVYRVIRRKQVGKTMMLEFQVESEDGRWKALSESRLRDTQASIEELLKLDYEAFTNASFLLQGKADAFTTRTPNKRKEILADLLGVSDWERLKGIASNRRKETENDLLLIDGRANDIDQELAEEPERTKELASAKAALEQIAGQLSIQERLLEQVRRTEAAVKHQRQIVANLTANLQQAKRTLAETQQTLDRRQLEREGYQALLDQGAEIEAAYKAWQGAEGLWREHQDKAEAYNAIEQAKRPHELALERERSRLSQRKLELENQAKRVSELESEHLLVSQEQREAQERLEQLAVSTAELAEKEEAWHAARARLQELAGERDQVKGEVDRLKIQAKRMTVMEDERLAVEKNLAEAEAAQRELMARLAAIDEQLKQLMTVQADLDRYRDQQPGLRQAMDKIKERIDRLREEEGGTCPLCGQPLSETHRRTVLAELQNEGEEKGSRYRENQGKIEDLTAEATQLEAQVKEKSRLERDLKAQQQRASVAQARLEEMIRALDEWQEDGAGRLVDLETALLDKTAIESQQSLVAELGEAVKRKGEQESELRLQQAKLSKAEARLAEIDKTLSAWADETTGPPAKLAAIKLRLDGDDILPEAQAALAELEGQAAALGYDPVDHQAARRQRDELAGAQPRFQELQQARSAAKPLDDNLADLRRQIEKQQQAVGALAQQVQDAQTQLDSLSSGADDLESVEKEVYALREREISAHRRVATAQQSVTVLSDLRRQRDQLVDQRAAVSLLGQRLKLLEKACGREGVQALLIERALPEIEDDANELLDRLTGGQMRVVFETQRKLKTSDRLAETLDIRIVDGAGERPYENFSGGEQFRVNFAIRLALSKILTKRAGARLQTLVIDEGFGSQDPDGRQRLIEAINTIQDDFERILVITHIDELQDAFPTRIQVEKGPAGSVVSVL